MDIEGVQENVVHLSKQLMSEGATVPEIGSSNFCRAIAKGIRYSKISELGFWSLAMAGRNHSLIVELL